MVQVPGLHKTVSDVSIAWPSPVCPTLTVNIGGGASRGGDLVKPPVGAKRRRACANMEAMAAEVWHDGIWNDSSWKAPAYWSQYRGIPSTPRTMIRPSLGLNTFFLFVLFLPFFFFLFFFFSPFFSFPCFSCFSLVSLFFLFSLSHFSLFSLFPFFSLFCLESKSSAPLRTSDVRVTEC